MTCKPYDATPPTKEGEVVAEKEKREREGVIVFLAPEKRSSMKYEITMASERQVATDILFKNE